MCGIVAYIEIKRIPILINGLKRLEYRGYDSSGIAIMQGIKFHCINREESFRFGSLLLIKIYLLQWVLLTHAGLHEENRTDQNAQSHLSEDLKLALIHNGIIENYLF